jgi:hypothetical protein
MKRLLAALVMLGLVLGALALAFAPRPASAFTPPRLKVAMVESQLSESWQIRNHEAKSIPREQIIATYLRSKGWDVTEVGDGALDTVQSAEQYDVIVLAHVFAINKVPSQVLQTFVRDGGGLVSLWGSPRVAPEKGDGWNAHWAAILNGESAEWGPLSEVYQVNFITDEVWDPKGNKWPRADYYAKTWPGASHPVLDGASRILKDRGYASGDYTYDSAFERTSGLGGFEIVNMLRASVRTATPILTFQFRSSEVLAYYPKGKTPGVYPAAEAVRYGLGRSVYFHFYPDDALRSDAIGAHTNPSGVPDRQAAAALLESAIQWTGTKDGASGAIWRGGKTWASLKVYGDGIYANQYVGDDGNVSALGGAKWRVYDPSGRLVASHRLSEQTYASVQPGQVRQYAWRYVPGPLKSGKYRVEVEYDCNYPSMTVKHVERAYVVRSQGVNISTVPVATARTSLSAAGVSPNPMTPNGDGWNDVSRVNFTLSQPARVSVKILDMWKHTVATAQQPVNLTPGPHSVIVPTKRSNGTALGNGQYYAFVLATNSAGTTSSYQLFFVGSYKKALPALGTSPRITGVVATPSPFTPNGDGVADRVGITPSVTAAGYAVVKVLSWSGEVRTLANNLGIAGSRTFTWDGKDSAGRPAPAGNYRYYVVVSGGGTSTQQLYTGLVKLSR